MAPQSDRFQMCISILISLATTATGSSSSYLTVPACCGVQQLQQGVDEPVPGQAQQQLVQQQAQQQQVQQPGQQLAFLALRPPPEPPP